MLNVRRVPSPSSLPSTSSKIITRAIGNLADKCNINVFSSPYPPIQSSNFAPVPEFVSSRWKDDSFANNVAIRDGSTGETRSFTQYRNRTNNIASALKSEYQLQPDDTVALFSPNNVDYLPICLAVGRCGAKVTPINPVSTASELSKILVLSKSTMLFTHAKLLPVALEAARTSHCVEEIVVIPDVQCDPNIPEGAEHLERLASFVSSSMEQEVSTQCCDNVIDWRSHPFLLPYSSGTIGLPKGVMLSHSNIVMNLLQLDEVERSVFHQDHKLIVPLPFFHIYGMLVSLLYCAWRGQELITMSERFDIEKFCLLVQDHKPERAHLVPPIILGLAKHPVVDKFDMKSLKMIVSAAAPLGKESTEGIRSRLGLNVKQLWGMSELSPLGTVNSDADARCGSIGQLAASTEGKIIDPETGISLGPNENGELCIRGPQVMLGYLNDRENTKECISDEGWLRTGDQCYCDDDGYFYITDRIKELIKVRGFQVAPAELEELLLVSLIYDII